MGDGRAGSRSVQGRRRLSAGDKGDGGAPACPGLSALSGAGALGVARGGRGHGLRCGRRGRRGDVDGVEKRRQQRLQGARLRRAGVFCRRQRQRERGEGDDKWGPGFSERRGLGWAGLLWLRVGLALGNSFSYFSLVKLLAFNSFSTKFYLAILFWPVDFNIPIIFLGILPIFLCGQILLFK